MLQQVAAPTIAPRFLKKMNPPKSTDESWAEEEDDANGEYDDDEGSDDECM